MKVCPACGAEYADDAAFCARDRTPLRPTERGAGLVGQVIGERYQIEKQLGEGGMGEVYLARHVLMDRPCALKVMMPSLSRDPAAVGRFNREATNASRISHANVCAIYDFGLTPDGLIYLAMELVEGRTLGAIAAEAGTLSLERAADLVIQAAAGLQAAHDLGIVHRDLKPDNVMVVSGREGRESVKLVDFGIAKAMAGAGARRSDQEVTRTGFVVGTPEYMSPEQLAGDPLDGRTDQYALALVFYRLVTGRLPFEGDSVHSTLAQRLTTPPVRLEAARPDGRFPVALQAVVDRALARDPAARFESVTAFAQALRAAVSGDSAPTRVLSPEGRAIPPTRVAPRAGLRRRGILVGLALVLTGGAVGAVVLTRDGTDRTSGTAPDSATPGELAVKADTLRPDSTGLESARSTPPPPSAPASPAVVPAASRDRGGETSVPVPPVAVDTALPDPEELDQPIRREMAMRRLRNILNARRLPARQRAFAAQYLADAYLGEARRDPARRAVLLDSARYYAQRAVELNPRPEYRELLRSLQDTAPR